MTQINESKEDISVPMMPNARLGAFYEKKRRVAVRAGNGDEAGTNRTVANLVNTRLNSKREGMPSRYNLKAADHAARH